MLDQPKESVGHGINPPLLFGSMVGALLLHKAFSLPSPLPKAARIAGIPLVLFGLFLGGSAVAAQRRAGTPVNPTQPTQAIVQGGPYRFTRNPIYLGMALAYSGLALLLNAVWGLLLLPVMVIALDRGMIRGEEAYLERNFGEVYRQYKDRVRRWL